MDGVVVIIRDNEEYLLIQDTNGDFEGYWAPVHGSLEAGETPEEAGVRETNEEVNLDITLSPADKLTTTPADYKPDDLHWFVTDTYSGEIEVDEREVAAYRWVTLEDLEEMPLLPQAETVFEKEFLD